MAWLDGLAGRGMRLRLDAMRAMLAELGNPHETYRVVHVGGTNGKGSVAAIAASILRAAGHRTALYTSPHLVRLAERFVVDGQPIGEAELAAAATAIRPVVERAEAAYGPVTHFEALTLLAYWWFCERGVEVAVIEVGMGGRLDATNVHARPLATVVTNVTLEHTETLGKTVEAIAAEKAAIARPGVPLLTGASDEALAVLRAHAASLGAPLAALGAEFAAEVVEEGEDRQEILLLGLRREYGPLETRLLGAHQAANVALAVAACEAADQGGFPVPPEAVVAGVAAARWPGRLQWLRRAPALLVDGAHNPAGCEALAAYLSSRKLRVTLVFGCMADKDWSMMVTLLAPVAERAVVTRPPSGRALDPRDLASAFARAGVVATHESDVRYALSIAREQAGEGGTVVVAGSLYLAGEVLRLLGQPGI